MKCVVVTGTTGSERRQYLETLKESTRKPEKLLVMDPWLKTKEMYTNINEATILNVSDEDRHNYFHDAYKAIAHDMDGLRKITEETVVVVPMHSVFYWKSVFKDAIRDEFLESLFPDLFVTIVHNMKVVKANLDNDRHQRFPDDTSFPEILQSRQREIQETNRWASMFKERPYNNRP